MDWLAGIPEILAVTVGSGIAIAAALWLAGSDTRSRALRLDALFAWLLPAAERAPAADIERLAALADLAKREGLLSLEAHTASSGDELIESGLRLLIEGAPRGQLRRELELLLDARIARQTRAGGGRWTRVSHLAVLAAAVCGLVITWRVGTTAPGLWQGVAAFFVCYASLLGIAFVGPACDRAFAVAGAGRALEGLMTIEAIMLISQGADADSVRAALTALMPPSTRTRATRAAA